jgi:transposase
MSRCPRQPLRPLTQRERQALEKIVRCGSERADVVARAREVLAVALGASYRDAAAGALRPSAEVVAKLVARFNREGLAALEAHGRGGPKPHYDAQARQRILAEALRAPDPELDGTTSWSLMTLRRALRSAPDGLPHVSAYTIGQVLHASGYRWLAARSGCETGRAVRKRRTGTVKVTDPDSEAQKTSDRACLPRGRAAGPGGMDAR